MQYDLTSNDVLYFLHIPKTAGVSLTNILDNMFDAEFVYSKGMYRNLFQNIPVNLSKFRMISGHFGFGLLKLIPKKPFIVTMLRNPVDQLLSFYDQHCRAYQNNNWSILKSQDEPLVEIFHDPLRKEAISNIQVGHLTFDIDISLITSIFNKEGIKRERFLELFSPKVDLSKGKELLNLAKQRLSNLAFFGISEKFEESMFLLYYTFGWYPVPLFPSLNVAPKKTTLEDLSDNVIQFVQDATRLDEELYNYGLSVFESRFSNMVKDLKEKYYETKYDKMNFNDMMYSMLEKNYFQRNFDSKIPSYDNIDYDFSKKMIGSGWHDRETDADNIIRRWSGPGTKSLIYFFLSDKNDLNIQFSVVGQMSQEILESLKLEVNNNPITLTKKPIGSDRTIFEGTIPKQFLQNKPITCLTFLVNRTVSPKSIDPNSRGTRLLGLLFEKIILTSKNSTIHKEIQVGDNQINLLQKILNERKVESGNIDNLLSQKESEVEDLKKKISSLEKEFELKDSQIDNLKNSINEIHQSFTWKMLRKYDQIKGKTK